MTLEELMKELKLIAKVHPEALEADVWAVDGEGVQFPVMYIGFDKSYRHPRIKLEA